MFKYHIDNGHVLIPIDDFSKVKQSSKIIDADKVITHLEYPNGIIVESVMTINGADITINKELVKNANGDYELKEKI